jgi:hypothetical protein
VSNRKTPAPKALAHTCRFLACVQLRQQRDFTQPASLATILAAWVMVVRRAVTFVRCFWETAHIANGAMYAPAV